MPDPVVDPIVDPVIDLPVVDPPGAFDFREDPSFKELPDDIRGSKSLDSYKTVGALAKSVYEGQKLIGGSVRLPKEDSTPEEIADFHTKLGKPETAEGYELIKPELPDGVQWDEKLLGWFGEASHKANLTKAQAGALMELYNDRQFEMIHEAQKAQGVELNKLKESWGDQYDGRVELGVRGIEQLLPGEEGEELKKLMDSSGFGDHPLMIKYAYQIGKLLKADGYIIGDGKMGVHGPESAKAEIAKINADKDHSYHKGDVEALKRMGELFKVAYPGKEPWS